MNSIQEVVLKFNTIPFLFIGSGISRRYYNLPDWIDLLKHFAELIKKDRFSFNSYLSKAKSLANSENSLSLTASLIQKDFDEKWFTSPEIRKIDEEGMKLVENGVSPFKIEIATYLSSISKPIEQYKNEISRLKNISVKNLSGIITTNYDCFFEKLFNDYKTYIGQDELCFSPIQGIAEIYKIHGSISRPDSIVINKDDYDNFNNKGKYLAAKLMTIFMEYPIIFMGYSLSDNNIRRILQDIVDCVPNNKLSNLQDRFVFIEWNKGFEGYSISSHSIDLNGKILPMTKIILDDYSLLYNALLLKKASLPVRILRRFKEELYTYVITSKQTPIMRVAPIDDEHINENSLAISIGVSEYGINGLKSITDSDNWYRDIILDDLKDYGYSYDEILEYGFTGAFKGCSQSFLPVYKYLTKAKKEYPEIKARAAKTFDDLVSNSIKKDRNKFSYYTSVLDIWEKVSNKKACRLIAYLPEKKISVNELEDVLKKIFTDNKDVLSDNENWNPSDIRRLIRIYDYLKWSKKDRD